MAKPVVTIVGLPSFLEEPEIETRLDDCYPDGNRIVEIVATGMFGCDPAVLAEVRERLNRCTSLDEIEHLLEEFQNDQTR